MPTPSPGDCRMPTPSSLDSCACARAGGVAGGAGGIWLGSALGGRAVSTSCASAGGGGGGSNRSFLWARASAGNNAIERMINGSFFMLASVQVPQEIQSQSIDAGDVV